VEEALYFCCLEALQNITKHADASHVDIHIAPIPSGVRLSIYDDGVGFNVRAVAAGRGLTNMRERVDAVGGTLSINSIPSQRTHIDVYVSSSRAVPAEEP
jgi:signal transduction histidine kinase